MKNLKYYLDNNYTKKEIRQCAIEEISDAISFLYDEDALELVNDFNDGDNYIYGMSELDDEFDNLTVTEILTELEDIDVNDDYFNKDLRCSSCDVWELSHLEYEDIAKEIVDDNYNYDGSCREIRDIYYDYCDLIQEYEYIANKRKLAISLIEMADIKDIDGIITMLWNRKEN